MRFTAQAAAEYGALTAEVAANRLEGMWAQITSGSPGEYLLGAAAVLLVIYGLTKLLDAA